MERWGNVVLFLVIGLTCSCSLPNDVENSWEEAHIQGLMVGVVPNPPFTEFINGEYRGQEVRMVKKFAKTHGLELVWVEGSESTLIERMKHYNLHIIIGGFKGSTVWKNEVGLTHPYNKENVWLVARGENNLVKQVEEYFIKTQGQP